MAHFAGVLADLNAECAELDELVSGLTADDWRRETPAPGWTIAHQIGHLAWTDEIATLAATDADEFGAVLRAAVEAFDTYVDRGAEEWAALPPTELLAGWRTGRQALGNALSAVPDGTRLPWFGPPMSPMSMVTARLMECWAHGLDVADTLGVQRPITDRIKHVAHLGVRARDYAYLIRDEPKPAEPFRVELIGPSEQLWTWGPEEALQRITGPAIDFCYLVTQRRHRDDLALVAEGADADHWLDIAQVFAGPSGQGRKPGQFTS